MSLLLYVLALTGVGASSLLAADYVRDAAVFCGEGGGCDIVRASAYAEILGVKTPFLGLAFFAVALLLAVWPARRLLVLWSAGGALFALGFLYVQAFVLRVFCPFCVIADLAALLLFAVAVATRRSARSPRPGVALALAAATLGLIAAPHAVPAREPPPPPAPVVAAGDAMPEVIARLQRPGVVTIVEFADFECPFCRRLHQTLEEVVASYGDKVRIVRKHLPLTKLHPNAMTAAMAACCADEVGVGDRMADALFRAPPEELTPEGCERLAAEVGADLARYRECMASDRPRKQVEQDQADARAAGLGQSVPVFFVGGKVHRGAQRAEVIRAAIDLELAALQ
jgi:protein-disulfide isomerase